MREDIEGEDVALGGENVGVRTVPALVPTEIRYCIHTYVPT